MDLAAILKLLKDNPEMLKTLLPVIEKVVAQVLADAVKQLVDGILEKV